jgi:hypothetical protein
MRNGRYPYQGLVNGQAVLAGASDPEIIIDR